MKKILLGALLVCGLSTMAQNTVTDSAVLGSGLANDVFYSMQNGTIATVPTNNWHIAFSVRNPNITTFDFLRSATIRANEGSNVAVYLSGQTEADWATFDTAGYTSWVNPHNSDSTWDIGAFNYGYNVTLFNFGWGDYSQASHDITGDKVYLVKIGSTFKKVLISKLVYDTTWIFTTANIDGTDSVTITINKADYAGKLFAYVDLLTNTVIDREPAAKWELLFGKYGAFVTQYGQTMFLSTTGVLSYPTVQTSEVSGIPVSEAVAGTYVRNIENIGTDWKINPGPGQPGFVVKDSLSYFVKDANGREDKLVFVSMTTGSTTGVITFNKTQTAFGTGLSSVSSNVDFTIYPNPANSIVNIAVSIGKPGVKVILMDITGKVVAAETAAATTQLDVSGLNKGVYFISVEAEGKTSVRKLIIN